VYNVHTLGHDIQTEVGDQDFGTVLEFYGAALMQNVDLVQGQNSAKKQ